MDIPIQHCADPVLKRMNRKAASRNCACLCKNCAPPCRTWPIRTTLMVGFPGETQEDFERLCRFVEDMRFDRLGVFAYSREEDTRAYDMPDQIDEDVKNERAQIIMDIQAQVAFQKSEELVGKTLTVMPTATTPSRAFT